MKSLREYPLASRLENFTDQELVELGNAHSSFLDFLSEEQIKPFLARVGHLLTDLSGEETNIEIEPEAASRPPRQ